MQSNKGYIKLAKIIDEVRQDHGEDYYGLEITDPNLCIVNLHDLVEQIGYEMRDISGFNCSNFIQRCGFVDRLKVPKSS